jgi:hypothetical protein
MYDFCEKGLDVSITFNVGPVFGPRIITLFVSARGSANLNEDFLGLPETLHAGARVVP